jgi:hypothetical protein
MQLTCQTPEGLFPKVFRILSVRDCDFLRGLAKIARRASVDFLRVFAGAGV